jgi:N-acyl-D-aspartate/D-glutamate deacylase
MTKHLDALKALAAHAEVENAHGRKFWSGATILWKTTDFSAIAAYVAALEDVARDANNVPHTLAGELRAGHMNFSARKLEALASSLAKLKEIQK